MSRRFGRNQRRRARGEVAQLREAVDMANGLTRHVSERANRLQEEIDRAKDLLPEGSILFEPGEFKFDGPVDVPAIRIKWWKPSN